MLESKNIYLSDDDADDRDFFTEAVYEISKDHKLTLSINGAELIEQLQRPPVPLPDIIFLDINMPRKDGIQSLDEIRKNELTENIPVVMYSTSANPDHINKAHKLGANFYFVKPSDYKSLKQRIAAVLAIDWSRQAFPVDSSQFVLC